MGEGVGDGRRGVEPAGGGEVGGVGDDVERTGLGAGEELAEVVGEDAEHDELDAAEEEDGAGEEGVAAEHLDAQNEALDDDDGGEQQADGQDDKPQVHAQA